MGVYRRKAQYHETDQMGIIHHSNYVKWMEEARIDFMKELIADKTVQWGKINAFHMDEYIGLEKDAPYSVFITLK